MKKEDRKYACITGFMGQIQDRFATYGTPRNFEQMVAACAQIPRTTGIECVYPQQITDPVAGKKILDNYGMKNMTSIKYFKEMVRDMSFLDYERRLRIGEGCMLSAFTSDDGREVLTAQEENRVPQWKNK